MWLIVRQLSMKAGWWDAPLYSPGFSQNNLLVVTGCHFWPRTIFRPPLSFVHPCLLIFRVSVEPPFIKTLPPHYFELESISSAQILLIVQATAIHHSIFYFSSFSMFLLVHFSVRRTSSIFKMNDVTTFQSLHHLPANWKSLWWSNLVPSSHIIVLAYI